MKAFVLALLLTLAGAIKQRSLISRAPDLAGAKVDDILAEIKQRVEVCGESKSPLAGATLDDMFAELKKREAAKECDGEGADKAAGAEDAAAADGGAAAAAPSAAGASGAPGGAPTPAPTTTTTTPCPDNFMDELVDQANPEFGLWDTNHDGCLSGTEMTVTLRKQIEVARHRDYYWIRRNITNGARNIIKDWTKDHAKADENDSECVNRDELKTVHEAICDCPTQFMLMDHNADGKISQQEASTYVADLMTHADLNYVTLSKIFKAADVDASKFLSMKEFCEAGPKYQGDGKDWLPAPAPGPGPAPAL